LRKKTVRTPFEAMGNSWNPSEGDGGNGEKGVKWVWSWGNIRLGGAGRGDSTTAHQKLGDKKVRGKEAKFF